MTLVRTGIVTGTERLADRSVDVLVGGVVIPAVVTDGAMVSDAANSIPLLLGVGASVTLLRVGVTWQVVAVMTGGAGGTPSLGPELIANGSFEFGGLGAHPDGWDVFYDFSAIADPLSRVDVSPLNGSACARIAATPGVHHNSILYSQRIRIDAGLTYRMACYLRRDPSTETTDHVVRLGVMTAASEESAALLGAEATNTVLIETADLTDQWQLVFADVTVPESHGWLLPYVQSEATDAADFTLYLDSVSLRRRIV